MNRSILYVRVFPQHIELITKNFYIIFNEHISHSNAFVLIVQMVIITEYSLFHFTSKLSLIKNQIWVNVVCFAVVQRQLNFLKSRVVESLTRWIDL